MNAIEIKTQVHSLDEVMDYFAKNFQPFDGEKIVTTEWYLDQSKGKVVFRLYVQKKEKP